MKSPNSFPFLIFHFLVNTPEHHPERILICLSSDHGAITVPRKLVDVFVIVEEKAFCYSIFLLFHEEGLCDLAVLYAPTMSIFVNIGEGEGGGTNDNCRPLKSIIDNVGVVFVFLQI